MEDKLRNKFKDWDDSDHQTNVEAIGRKDKIWSQLEINKKKKINFWPWLALILLLLLFGSLINQNTNNKDAVNTNFANQLILLKQSNDQLQEEIASLKNEILIAPKEPSIIKNTVETKIKYVERVVENIDTIYLPSIEQIIYRDRILVDTIYLKENANKVAEPLLITDNETVNQTDNSSYPKVINFDLRNPNQPNSPDKKEVIITKNSGNQNLKVNFIKTSIK